MSEADTATPEAETEAPPANADAGADADASAAGQEAASQAAADDGAEPAVMDNLVAESSGSDSPGGLDNILDIPVVLSVEIGSTRISIRNLLQFNQGSVVELDRLAGEPLDVLVNGTLIAHGEVVVVNEKFGIRVTDVVSARERVRKLQ